MANPLIHSKSSVKRWGGKVEDYIAIHELIDSPKATMNNNTSRALTHNTWFAYTIIPKNEVCTNTTRLLKKYESRSVDVQWS